MANGKTHRTEDGPVKGVAVHSLLSRSRRRESGPGELKDTRQEELGA
jgi:hypothetical protein